MQSLPHRYAVTATASTESVVNLSSPGLLPLKSAAPAEFGGPGDLWSPETLLAAAVADCFVLTFKAVARGSKMDWSELSCDVEGLLERVERVTRFTSFTLRVTLQVPAGTDRDKAMRLLHKAEDACLITNSMTATIELNTQVEVTA